MKHRELFLIIFYMYLTTNTMAPEEKKGIFSLQQLALNCINSNLDKLHTKLDILPTGLVASVYESNSHNFQFFRTPHTVTKIKTKIPLMVEFPCSINQKVVYEHHGKSICLCGGKSPIFKPSHLVIIAKKESHNPNPGPCSNDQYDTYKIYDPYDQSSITALSVHPIKNELCFGRENGKVTIVDLQKYKMMQEHQTHKMSIENIGYDNKGRIISVDKSIACVWNQEDGTLLTIYPIIRVLPEIDRVDQPVEISYNDLLPLELNKEFSKEEQLLLLKILVQKQKLLLAEGEPNTINNQALITEIKQSSLTQSHKNALISMLKEFAGSRSKNWIDYIKQLSSKIKNLGSGYHIF